MTETNQKPVQGVSRPINAPNPAQFKMVHNQTKNKRILSGIMSSVGLKGAHLIKN